MARVRGKSLPSSLTAIGECFTAAGGLFFGRVALFCCLKESSPPHICQIVNVDPSSTLHFFTSRTVTFVSCSPSFEPRSDPISKEMAPSIDLGGRITRDPLFAQFKLAERSPTTSSVAGDMIPPDSPGMMSTVSSSGDSVANANKLAKAREHLRYLDETWSRPWYPQELAPLIGTSGLPGRNFLQSFYTMTKDWLDAGRNLNALYSHLWDDGGPGRVAVQRTNGRLSDESARAIKIAVQGMIRNSARRQGALRDAELANLASSHGLDAAAINGKSNPSIQMRVKY